MKTLKQYINDEQRRETFGVLNLRTKQVQTLHFGGDNLRTVYAEFTRFISEEEYDNYVLAPKYEIGQEGYVVFESGWVCRAKINLYMWESECNEYLYNLSKIFTYPPKKKQDFNFNEFESQIYATESEALFALYNQLKEEGQ